MWKPMLPTLADDIPEGEEWVYEVKYDGFRAALEWTEEGARLVSRNGKDLTKHFPEIITFLQSQWKDIEPFLPLYLDGEVVILKTPLQTDFGLLQQRGRTKKEEKIQEHARNHPARFLCFDGLQIGTQKLPQLSYLQRKEKLRQLFSSLGWSLNVSFIQPVSLIPFYKDKHTLWRQLTLEYGEGIVAKQKHQTYQPGKRVTHWLKIKNWRKVAGFITEYDPENDYFTASIYHENEIEVLGVVKHGFSEEAFSTLTKLITEKGEKKGGIYHLPPAICVQINCLEAEDGQLREPNFDQFRFDLSPEECTAAKKEQDLAMLPEKVEITNPDKPLWPKPGFSKLDHLMYLRNIAPYMLPFLEQKRLTLIRYPHGVGDESFFQKHRPDYAPDFVGAYQEGGEEFIVCHTVETLLWIGNQGTLEFHIPFQKTEESYPDEIVFDLDPPSRKEFYLAIKAAKLLKTICDQLDLYAFVKTSGKKGLQVHLPLPEKALTYEETRAFTEAAAQLLVQKHPDDFTMERLKKNRGHRLYVDYVQHAEGKTIIAPYSPRATEEGTVATPLYWEEVHEELDPAQFTIKTVKQRISNAGCPMIKYKEIRDQQNFTKLKALIKGNH
ncbi:DNA ligase D [Virgibacillus sp. MSP4-1]|uniref:DNA ligase D n=1 Tax=Virgibacillus sp. MSP4-1 TaxID=2700081 RepID=UPI00039FB74C|nr:DNA ligase D [Virgibacillus sp. MSP4-1]QHS22045.1 DNA ligase D [Virgibacillus sp. MSP4-1]